MELARLSPFNYISRLEKVNQIRPSIPGSPCRDKLISPEIAQDLAHIRQTPAIFIASPSENV